MLGLEAGDHCWGCVEVLGQCWPTLEVKSLAEEDRGRAWHLWGLDGSQGGTVGVQVASAVHPEGGSVPRDSVSAVRELEKVRTPEQSFGESFGARFRRVFDSGSVRVEVDRR